MAVAKANKAETIRQELFIGLRLASGELYPLTLENQLLDLSRMKTIRWGIIGCGDVTEMKSGPAFQKAIGSELVAVMRRNAAKAQDYARRHGVPRWYDDADRLIADPHVD